MALLSGASVWLISVTCSAEQQKIIMLYFYMHDIKPLQLKITGKHCTCSPEVLFQFLLEMDSWAYNFPQLIGGIAVKSGKALVLYAFVPFFGSVKTKHCAYSQTFQQLGILACSLKFSGLHNNPSINYESGTKLICLQIQLNQYTSPVTKKYLQEQVCFLQ